MTRSKPLLSLAPAVALSAWLGAWPAAGQIQDAESASHADSASEYQIVDKYKYPGFEIVQFTLGVLSHYSYVIARGSEALVVDPGRDIQAYLNFVKEHDLAVKGVFLTHSHADFVAGHIEMAKAAGCPIYASAAGGAEYDHVAVKEGDEIAVGEALIRVIETPGHTPDGLCGLVFGSNRPDQPIVVFTGDTLFVGSIGRPDLLPKTMTAASLASAAYDTWHNKLSKVADEAVILPAHGAGSLCGAHLRDEPFSTIGAERTSNPYFQHAGRNEFIAAVLEGLPEAPQYFSHNAAMNRQGPELVDWDAPLPAEVQPSADLTDPATFYVVDIRSAPAYAAGHIPNSVNIALRGRFESWVGRMVPWEAKLILYGPNAELEEALRRLHRVGYKGSVLTPETYAAAGLPLAVSKTIPPQELYKRMQAGTAPIIVDVRLPEEWMGLRIGTVVNLPIDRLSQLASKLDPSRPTITVCNSAYRSSMALGLLEREGFKDLYNLDGGAEAWVGAGLPVLGTQTSGTATSTSTSKREVRLAERMSADELRRLLMDLPETFDLVDIRPPEHFADYSLPGAMNVDLSELLNNPTYLIGAGPLIIVDRDGSLAMMVAGILSQKTQRTVKALYGGLEAYWTDSMTAGFCAVRCGTTHDERAAAARAEGAHAACDCAAASSGTTEKTGQEECGVLTMSSTPEAPARYMNPYLAGFLLGLTLLGSFLILGAGLGASGGLARIAAFTECVIAPVHTRASEYFGPWCDQPLRYYLLFMLVGTFLGGLISAMFANRVEFKLERGAKAPAAIRGVLAIGGGVLIGFASRLAAGCTSGQALTGGALLLTGSLVFLVCIFAGGYAAAWFVRRQWDD